MNELRRDQLDQDKMRRTMILSVPAAPEPEVKKEPANKLPTFQALATAREDEFAPIRVGGKLDGYEVIDNLAEGGMGAVYRVKDREGNRDLALKAPLPDGRGGTFSHRLRRFLREVRLAERMNHPGVAKVVEVGQEDGLPYFTMELVDGTPFSERMYNGPMEIGEATAIIESAARAVHHIHEKGVIHRDLKPQNILVKRSGEVVIIDFGLARDAAGIDPRITQSGVWLGTPAYISPEQAQGEASVVDARADVYSLAAVLYEALTGAPPYGSGNTRQIFKNLKTRAAETVRFSRPECSAEIDAVVMKGLAKARDGRHATALEFADALAEARKSLAKIPVIGVHTSAERPVADLDVLESSPIMPALKKPETKSAAKKGDSHRVKKGSGRLPAAETAKGWTNLGSSNAMLKTMTAPIDEQTPRPRGTSTERRLRPAATGKTTRRLKQLAAAAELRRRALILCGPAILAVCGLLLLVLP